METLWRDVRLALRQLARDKGFSVAAILTLTLGLGASAAMLTILDGVLLEQLPYRDPARLVVLRGVLTDRGETQSWALSERDFFDWQKESAAFSQMSLFGELAFNLEHGRQSQRLTGELVNADCFTLLGLAPSLGRFFTPEEDARPMEQYVVVLGHHLWRTTFGGDPAVVGRVLRLNGKSFRVVGVGPAGYRGLTDKADLFVPSMTPPTPNFLTARGLRWAAAVARLAPGVTAARAQAQMNATTAALARELPADDRGFGATVTPLADDWFGKLRNGLLVLASGAGIILLIACINVASLLLARAAARQRSFGIRVALGASRGQMARQLFTESVLLALLGAAAGLLLSHWATAALVAGSGVHFPSFVRIGSTPAVAAGIVGLAIVCGLAFGMVPLWITFRGDLTQTLGRHEKSQPRGKGFQRFQQAVVVAQVALALALAVDAGLLAKGFRKLIGQDLGLHPGGVLTWRIDLRGPRFVDEAFDTQLLRREYLRRVAEVPGVRQLAMADPTVPPDQATIGQVAVEDHDSDSPDGTYLARMHAVTPAYFDLLGIPILRGRAFGAQDVQTNAVIVSKAMADQQWPGRDPIGRRIKLDGPRSEPGPWLSVVGVAGEVRHEGILGARSPAPDVYLSLLQFIRRPPLTVNFLVRPQAGVASATLRRDLHRRMMAIDPELPDYDMATMDERLARQADKARFQVLLIGIFTMLALVLAAIGIYGVISYSVTQRQREIAIRMALGADRRGILRMVVARGALLGAIGLALGLVAMLAMSGPLVGLLYQTSLTDPLVLGGTSLVLFLVTLAANYLPARRAAISDPTAGLRLQ